MSADTKDRTATALHELDRRCSELRAASASYVSSAKRLGDASAELVAAVDRLARSVRSVVR